MAKLKFTSALRQFRLAAFATACAAALGLAAPHAVASWSDTPIICHWIGAVKAGRTSNIDFAAWTNESNWAEGIVPGRFDKNGTTVGCEGCTAVFNRECTYAAVILDGLHSISNIVVEGSDVPKITIGRPWDYPNPYLYLERGGGIFVGADVQTAPEVRAGIYYRRGSDTSATTFNFENNSSTPLLFYGLQGAEPSFSAWAGNMTLAMHGTGEIRATGGHVRSKYNLYVSLDMAGGKFVQGRNATIDQINAVAGDAPQHFEVPSGITVTLPAANALALAARTDFLVDGAGTCNFSAAASSSPIIGVASGKTLMLDCAISRTSGGKFQIGQQYLHGGAVALASGRAFNAPVEFYNGDLRLADGLTLTDAVSIINADGRSGTLCGGTNAEAKISGGVAGATRPLTLKGHLAIASDITATTTLAGNATVSFRKAGDAATTFTISSLALADDNAILVEDGVTATITSIANNGHTLDILSSGAGRVVFAELMPGRAPAWLTYKGGKARIAADGTISGADWTVISFR